MGSWRKLLRKMANDPKPTGYTYEDAARILKNLNFALAPAGGSSHRKWRRNLGGDPPIIARVGLVESGHGPIPREYIQDMIAVLQQHNLIPTDETNG